VRAERRGDYLREEGNDTLPCRPGGMAAGGGGGEGGDADKVDGAHVGRRGKAVGASKAAAAAF
jgi:hypothetical protein